MVWLGLVSGLGLVMVAQPGFRLGFVHAIGSVSITTSYLNYDSQESPSWWSLANLLTCNSLFRYLYQ